MPRAACPRGEHEPLALPHLHQWPAARTLPWYLGTPVRRFRGCPVAKREYDDERQLMAYVWRNYPHIVRAHECVASPERERDELPPELR